MSVRSVGHEEGRSRKRVGVNPTPYGKRNSESREAALVGVLAVSPSISTLGSETQWASNQSQKSRLGLCRGGFTYLCNPVIVLQERLDGFDDRVGVDLGGVHQLGRLAGAGHDVDRELDDRRRVVADTDEGVQHGVADAALEPVVFDHDQLAAGVLSSSVQGLFVDGLDGVGVDDTDVDAFRFQPLIGFQCFVERDALPRRQRLCRRRNA